MLLKDIYIQTISQVSAAKTDQFSNQNHYLQSTEVPTGKLHSYYREQLSAFLQKHPHFRKLDRTTQLVLLAAQPLKTFLQNHPSKNVGVNIGSSRGATETWEREYQKFQQHGTTSATASPITSLGNISSWVAQYLQSNAIAFSHSMTCSTSLLSLINGLAWLQSDLADTMIVGGSEAPLTAFTLAQLKAMRLYGKNEKHPCQAGNFNKSSNAMILGEAAALAILTKNSHNALARVAGVGLASESIDSPTYISENAEHLQQSMQEALKNAQLTQVDLLVSHTPGTILGDQAEKRAIEKILGTKTPVTNNKWKIGHTFGASGIMSIAYALDMFQSQKFYPTPFDCNPVQVKQINHIMINATGFGGNAVSIILENMYQ